MSLPHLHTAASIQPSAELRSTLRGDESPEWLAIAASAAANLLAEYYQKAKEVTLLSWSELAEYASTSSIVSDALQEIRIMKEWSPLDFRTGDWVIMNGLSCLVRLNLLTIDESTEIDLFAPTDSFWSLFTS